jgi:iron-sulfur cluster assembly protein
MIDLTPAAVAEVKRLLSERGQPDALVRFGVEAGGCSGLQYSMDFAPMAGENDRVFELGDLRVACDEQSMLYLSGLTVDFSRAVLGGGFKFLNPNAKQSCGCGTSFRV